MSKKKKEESKLNVMDVCQWKKYVDDMRIEIIKHSSTVIKDIGDVSTETSIEEFAKKSKKLDELIESIIGE